MQRDNFEQSIRDFQQRAPFEQYVVELKSGRMLTVDHPEALITRAGRAVHMTPEGRLSFFDADGVAQVTELPEDSPLKR